MKKAIVLSYVTYQNEPSIPDGNLWDIPESEDEQLAVLKEIAKCHFGEDLEFDMWEREYETAYGDVAYTDANEDLCIFLTYVTEASLK